jgi:protein transport protein SEC24
MYPNFMAARDGYRFAEDLRRVITRNFGFDGILRVRCGNGLRVAEHFGNFHMRNSTDVEFGVIDSEKALAVQFTHDSKLSENTDMSFQVALLYTSSLGRRLIRVMNYSMQCTAQIGNLFRLAEMDSIVNFATKSGTIYLF